MTCCTQRRNLYQYLILTNHNAPIEWLQLASGYTYPRRLKVNMFLCIGLCQSLLNIIMSKSKGTHQYFSEWNYNFLSISRFLQHLVMPNNTSLCLGSDYRIVLLCNAYSTNQDNFSRPMAALVETILGNQKSTMAPTSGTGSVSGAGGGSSSGSGTASGTSAGNSGSMPIVRDKGEGLMVLSSRIVIEFDFRFLCL